MRFRALWRAVLACVAGLAVISPARSAERQTPPSRRALAAGTAIVPGLVLHGSGQWVLGRKQTALRLLGWEAAGLGLILAGGTPIVLTGASRKIVGPSAAVAITGIGLFTTTLLADLYATTGLEEASGSPVRQAPSLESEVGYRYVYHPHFRYHNLLTQALSARIGRLQFAGSLWTGLDDNVARTRLLTGWRFWGPLPRPHLPAADGSFVDLLAGGSRWQFAPYGFDKWTGELFLSARLDLARLDRALRQSFVEGGVGWAREWVRFALPGGAPTTQADDLLLARFAFGVLLGNPARRGAEARVYYDHRHDDWVSGMAMRGVGSGVIGHFGIDARCYLDAHWGFLVEAQTGAAHLFGVAALLRPGMSG